MGICIGKYDEDYEDKRTPQELLTDTQKELFDTQSELGTANQEIKDLKFALNLLKNFAIKSGLDLNKI